MFLYFVGTVVPLFLLVSLSRSWKRNSSGAGYKGPIESKVHISLVSVIVSLSCLAQVECFTFNWSLFCVSTKNLCIFYVDVIDQLLLGASSTFPYTPALRPVMLAVLQSCFKSSAMDLDGKGGLFSTSWVNLHVHRRGAVMVAIEV